MKIIGIMGGVGSGKSTVANVMRDHFNAHVILTDDVAKRLSEKGGISYQLILNYFGNEILQENGEIDRKRLGSIVFLDKEKLEILNSFTHPYVKEAVICEIEEVKQLGKASYILIETALLIEAGYRHLCDEVWYVTVDERIRRERLALSRGYTDEKTDSILKNQMSENDFRDNCDKIIYNNDNIENLVEQIQKLLVDI